MGTVFRKLTRMSVQSAASTGHILNLVSSDAERFVEIGVARNSPFPGLLWC